jgi:hypothetical protein
LTSRWLISIPCWGDAWVRRFLETGLPSIDAALEGFEAQVRFVVHTNSQLLRLAMSGREFIRRDAKVQGNRYKTLTECHREAIAMGQPGERICFLNADHIVSVKAFRSAERRLREGFRAVACGCVRARADDPPIGAEGRDLLAWAWKNSHPLVLNCIYGTGRSQCPSFVYFENRENVTLRAFHMHPFAVMKDRPLRFAGETIDQDLLYNYRRPEIHVVTDPDEVALAEITGMEHEHPSGSLLSAKLLAAFGRGATPLHRWFFTHSIRIRGYDPVDESPAEEALKILRENRLTLVQ